MADMKAALTAIAGAPERIHIEIFTYGESRYPQAPSAQPRERPHPLSDEATAGPLVSSARSGISTHWDAARYASILEMAEAVMSRSVGHVELGVCHTCEGGLGVRCHCLRSAATGRVRRWQPSRSAARQRPSATLAIDL